MKAKIILVALLSSLFVAPVFAGGLERAFRIIQIARMANEDRVELLKELEQILSAASDEEVESAHDSQENLAVYAVIFNDAEALKIIRTRMPSLVDAIPHAFKVHRAHDRIDYLQLKSELDIALAKIKRLEEEKNKQSGVSRGLTGVW